MSEQPVLQPPPAYRNIPNSTPNPGGASASNQTLPVRKPYVPAYKPRRKRRSCCRLFCCCCCPILLFLIIILAIVSACFYLLYEPQLPNFHLQSFKFQQFNVSINPNGAYLNYQMEAKIKVVNPNSKMRIDYDQIAASLSIGQDDDEMSLGTASVPPFAQVSKNTTYLRFNTGPKKMLVDDDDAPQLKDKFKSKKLVINVVVKTKVGVGVDSLKTGKMAVKVSCGGITLKDLGGSYSPKCTVNVLNMVNLN